MFIFLTLISTFSYRYNLLKTRIHSHIELLKAIKRCLNLQLEVKKLEEDQKEITHKKNEKKESEDMIDDGQASASSLSKKDIDSSILYLKEEISSKKRAIKQELKYLNQLFKKLCESGLNFSLAVANLDK